MKRCKVAPRNASEEFELWVYYGTPDHCGTTHDWYKEEIEGRGLVDGPPQHYTGWDGVSVRDRLRTGGRMCLRYRPTYWERKKPSRDGYDFPIERPNS